ncbi:dnaJ-like subfamily A member 2 [Histomonas meleagridis]|uniref:dnaJ-like subfamily A member 2 n=2 Tax=Histomonas meleagridis TaxID=135588 RepID=UPI00355A5A8B|nr:dnaJ-like subfamily A member 2 [Histomonas meleagridis]
MVVDTRLYDILGVSPDASQRQIKRAFQQKARELHPDKNHDDPSSTEQFQEINEAYEILKDPKKRRSYDQFGLQGGSVFTREINTCSKCNGSGEVIEARDVCTECNGECTVETAKYIKVDIKRGMENGETIIFKGESDEAPNVEAGDLVVVVEEAEHEYFKRSYSNLLYEKDVQLSEALLGAAFAIRHLDDRIIIAHTPEAKVITPNCVMCIEGEGMPKHNNELQKGNLYIRFNVIFPIYEQITTELIEALNSINVRRHNESVQADDEEAFAAQMRDPDEEETFGSHRSEYRRRNETYYTTDSESDEERSCGVM